MLQKCVQQASRWELVGKLNRRRERFGLSTETNKIGLQFKTRNAILLSTCAPGARKVLRLIVKTGKKVCIWELFAQRKEEKNNRVDFDENEIFMIETRRKKFDAMNWSMINPWGFPRFRQFIEIVTYTYIYIVRGISIVVGGTSEHTISSDITWKVFRSSMPHVQNAGNIWMVHRGRCPSVQSISVFNLRMVGWLLGNVYYWTASPEFGRRKSILSILNANNFDIVAWTYLCT